MRISRGRRFMFGLAILALISVAVFFFTGFISPTQLENMDIVRSCNANPRFFTFKGEKCSHYFETYISFENEIVMMFVTSENDCEGRSSGIPSHIEETEVYYTKYAFDIPKQENVIEKFKGKCSIRRTESEDELIPRERNYFHCDIPRKLDYHSFESFHVRLEVQKGKNEYIVHDCRFHQVREKPIRHLVGVMSDWEYEQLSHWLKYMYFIGFEYIDLWLHNPEEGLREKVLTTFGSENIRVSSITISGFYRRIQDLMFFDLKYRTKADWIFNNDLDEYPVFFPNLLSFTSKSLVEREEGKISGITLSALQFTHHKSDKNSSLSENIFYFDEFSPVLRNIPCSAFVESRPKTISRQQNIKVMRNHQSCPEKKDGKLIHADHNDAFIAHFFSAGKRKVKRELDLRVHPLKIPENPEILTKYGNRTCYHDILDMKKNSNLQELFFAYDEIISKCDGKCKKNEVELQDKKLVRMKKKFRWDYTSYGFNDYIVQNVDQLQQELLMYRCYEIEPESEFLRKKNYRVK